ncbi:MAG: hypothetical protein ACK48H_21250 [Microcystis sp.]|uniref:hypothetical protein n=1 Tax=Microcystis sp. TaxID=1127 RepID=UPI00391964FF
MGVPVTFLSANSRSLLGNAVIDLVPNETYLVVPWSEVSASLAADSPAPNTLEDWIAAINYRLVDQCLADTNPLTGTKITLGLRIISEINGKGLDSGVFEPGSDLIGYQITTTIYSLDNSPARPLVSDL